MLSLPRLLISIHAEIPLKRMAQSAKHIEFGKQ
jgi:hypothetical protein